ncbi:dioxygenase [Marinobacter sp. NP-4(2019)]|uniref:dioxygenase family protein n=1 Tax=Marinobacter sp. NP-4(2019) TaxID=2488665 RepID=UPI000FC3D188|nr:class III extradiol ring-cleavage dioxygenase [Marinobacter sp. NP-4(2019)]AZT83156.1 dioxygenase [Marinobacter sp. NP-4(2019)]
MKTLPSLFVSHGAPTFALDPGRAGQGLAALGRTLSRTKAILVVSPHWMTPDVQVSTAIRPETIHDFGGFDPTLYDILYPAAGAPRIASRALELLSQAGWPATANQHQGLDHGAWVPLLHLFPKADVPVFQVSMPMDLDAEAAFGLGRALAPLADEGVLIIGSGSLTHNLYEFRNRHDDGESYAIEFSQWIRRAVLDGDHHRLVHALDLAPHARRAHPTTEHFLPLLVALGAANSANEARVIEGGIQHGVLAMDSFVFG